jgi:thiol-disulfide isomerase/thioredoxin
MAFLRPHSPCDLPRQFRRFFLALLIVLPVVAFGREDKQSPALTSANGPKNPKAAKTFHTALEWQKRGSIETAMNTFRKAFVQDDRQCASCLSHAYNLALSIGAYKDAEEIARDWLPLAISDSEKGSVHYGIGACLEQQGILDKDKKDKFFEEARGEFQTAFDLNPSLTVALYNLGVSLANLHQDDEAKATFQRFLERDESKPSLHPRAQRYIERIELARAKMAPPFSFTALDGQPVSIDSLAGKVVLIDFWATWCGPCREALPHMREIAHKFAGQPFVMISVSLDTDEKKWREFVAKNGMTWIQYHEAWSSSDVARLFNVNAIPATFSIDADGVLEDQHVGDANIDGKLRKMVARAVEIANQKPIAPSAAQTGGSSQ